MNILALDIAKKTGWANSYGKGGMKQFKMGYKEVPGLLFFRYRQWLQKLLEKYPVEVLYYEASFHQPGHAARVANGLIAITEVECFLRGIDLCGVQSSAIKKHATGSGDQRKKHVKGKTKQLMLKAARKKWDLRLEDDNYLDALWLLDFARTQAR